MRNKKLTRRKLLQQAGALLSTKTLLAGGGLSLLEVIIQGAFHKAVAQEQGISPRRWVDMRFDNAPPRWVYDLFLQASAEDSTSFTQGTNQQLITRYTEVNGVYTAGIYATTQVGSVRAPYIWQINVPAVGGGMRPMKDLLNNFLNLRGIYSNTSGHFTNGALHYHPPGAAKGIAALAADESTDPINAIERSASYFALYSSAGRSAVRLAATGNSLTTLLAPFRPSTSVSQTRSNESAVLTALTEARSSLGDDSVARAPNTQNLRIALQGARELIFNNFGDLSAQWVALNAKYAGLISRSLALVIPGINDKPIGIAPNLRGTNKNYQLGRDYYVQATDLRSIFGASTTLARLAEAFALVEFVLVNNLSHSVTVPMAGITGLKDGTSALAYGFDEHYIGSLSSLLINSLQAAAHASCLLELIDRLKAAQIWNDTVINCSGEMNRIPGNYGHGSEHAASKNFALYSGCIDGPLVLGNIVRESTGDSGTWGKPAPLAEIGGYVDSTHAINTVAALLGVNPVVPSRSALVRMVNGRAVATVPVGKII